MPTDELIKLLKEQLGGEVICTRPAGDEETDICTRCLGKGALPENALHTCPYCQEGRLPVDPTN